MRSRPRAVGGRGVDERQCGAGHRQPSPVRRDRWLAGLRRRRAHQGRGGSGGVRDRALGRWQPRRPGAARGGHPSASGRPLLYLAGAERAGDLAGALRTRGIAVETAVVYRSVMVTSFDSAVQMALGTLPSAYLVFGSLAADLDGLGDGHAERASRVGVLGKNGVAATR